MRGCLPTTKSPGCLRALMCNGRVTEHENRGTSRAPNVDNTDVRERPGRQPGSGSELVRAELRGLVDVKNANFVVKLVPGWGCK